MKIYKVEFSGMWPVPCGLIIAAPSLAMATIMTDNTFNDSGMKGTKRTIVEVNMEKPSVIFYESGDY